LFNGQNEYRNNTYDILIVITAGNIRKASREG